MYFGSAFVEQDQSPVSTQGLPGTNNILVKWGSNLRGFHVAPPSMHEYLRNEESSSPVAELESISSLADVIPQGGAKQPIDNGSDGLSKDGADIKSEVHQDHNHPITGSEIAPLLASSLRITEGVYFEGPLDLDASDLVIGAWIYLNTVDGENTMRTVFTNKASGCEGSPDRYGVSMYVNEWGTSNHQLYVEFGNSVSGCHKVTSNDIQLLPNKWYHVALSMVGLTTRLHIDGTVVGKVEDQLHSAQYSSPMLVGSFDRGEYSLFGNVSHFAIAHPIGKDEADTYSIADTVIKKMMHVAALPHDHSSTLSLEDRSKDCMVALFEFSDYPSVRRRSADPTHLGDPTVKETIDTIGGKKGAYFFSTPLPPGLEVSDVPIVLVDGLGANRKVTDEMREESDRLGRQRREIIKSGMVHAWSGYQKYAWGRDELKPITQDGGDPWGGMGVTLVDSLDTLW